MLDALESLTSKKWLSLIGRPRLTLSDHKCNNIVCGSNDSFKKYSDKYYICKCGYEIEGEFNETKHKMSLYCGINKCIEDKVKMDLNCIKCQYIRER